MTDFTREHAREDDVDTSKAAAASIENSAQRHKEIVLTTLKVIGPLSSEQIASVTGLEHAQTWRRVSDLKNAGLIIDSGERRKNRSGRDAAVWRVKVSTDGGNAYAEATGR